MDLEILRAVRDILLIVAGAFVAKSLVERLIGPSAEYVGGSFRDFLARIGKGVTERRCCGSSATARSQPAGRRAFLTYASASVKLTRTLHSTALSSSYTVGCANPFASWLTKTFCPAFVPRAPGRTREPQRLVVSASRRARTAWRFRQCRWSAESSSRWWQSFRLPVPTDRATPHRPRSVQREHLSTGQPACETAPTWRSRVSAVATRLGTHVARPRACTTLRALP